MTTRLQSPLRETLETALPEEHAQRIWIGIGSRRERRRSRRRSIPIVLAAALALVIAAALPWLGRPESSTIERLARADGAQLVALEGGERAEHAARPPGSITPLSDGSRIEVSPRGRLEVLHNDGRVFVTVLRRGAATFDVRPGGSRRWTVETSLGSVDVVGTRFRVDKGEHSVKISVSHGVVVVRSETLPERVRRLGAGEELILSELAANAVAPEPRTPTSQELPAPPVRAEDAEVGVREQAPGSTPDTDRTPSFDERLRRADAARASGNRAAAVEQLRLALADSGGGSRRAMAAFSLGKLLLELGRNAEAAEAFAACSRLSPPAALAEDVLVRRIEAEARAGRVERARELASAYDQRYPSGRRRGEVSKWVERP